MRVLLISTPALGHREDEVLGELRDAGVDVMRGDTAMLDRDGVADFDVIAGPGSMRADAELFGRCPRLRGMVSFGSGCEGFDRSAAAARAIAIATGGADRSVRDMASATIMLMLALCHNLPGAMAAHAQASWCDRTRVRTLDDTTVGIVGYGAIGRETARRLRAWGVRVLVFSRSLEAGELADGSESVPFQQLLRASDIVSLHARLNHGGGPIIDRAALATMKPGALLVNTARGALVDEGAVADALRSGLLGGAALDCFAIEPLPMDSPLRGAPNAILTPHQIGHTPAGADAMVRTFIDNIIRIAAEGTHS